MPARAAGERWREVTREPIERPGVRQSPSQSYSRGTMTAGAMASVGEEAEALEKRPVDSGDVWVVVRSPAFERAICELKGEIGDEIRA